MHKKTERSNYALPSSAISDIPLSIGKRESQVFFRGQATEFKQNSSIFNAFNQSRSRAEQSLSLHYSTAKPFYGEFTQEYYDEKEMGEKHIYNIQQQKDHYIMERVRQKKSPNKRLMVFSYSNIKLLRDKIDKIVLEQKKRIFMMLYRVKKEDKTYGVNVNNKNTSFYSGQTNNTSRKDALYRVNFETKRQDRYVFYQQILKALNIIQGWQEYRVLLDKRKTLNAIFQYGNNHKKFSLELSQSLKVENAHNQNYYHTDYQHSNQISLTNALPQQIQESLVYTLEHNGESTRKQLTQSTLQRYPTVKNYPTYTQIKQKGSVRQLQSQNSKKSSPVNKLDSFSSSYASPKPDIQHGLALKLQQRMLKNTNINLDFLIDCPLEFAPIDVQEQNKINDHEQAVQNNIINHNLSVNDQHETNSFDTQFKKIQTTVSNQQSSRKIQNSARYSDVSNYKMENTIQRPEQTYQVIVNYVTNNHQPVIQDQTVHRKQSAIPMLQNNTNSKFEKYYVVGKEPNPAISTPKFTSQIRLEQYTPQVRVSQQKLVSQLDNDRIRIFGRNNQQPANQATVIPQRIARLRGNFSPQSPYFVSNTAVPMTISSDKRIMSPKIQNQKNVINTAMPNRIPLQISSPRMIGQATKYQNPSPNYQTHRPILQLPKHEGRTIQRPMHIPIINNQRSQPEYQMPYHIHKHALSPQVFKSPNQILGQGPVIIRKQIALNQPRIMSPLKSLNQKRQSNSQQKVFRNIQRQDYGCYNNIPQHMMQYPVFKKMNPAQNHMVNVQKQYQLPQPQIKALKTHNQAPKQMHIRQNVFMNDLHVIQNQPKYEQKRPQSSASSPKLFFNYNSHTESHVDQQIILNSHQLTKNNSSLSRPKSMNSKLFVTLKKEL